MLLSRATPCIRQLLQTTPSAAAVLPSFSLFATRTRYLSTAAAAAAPTTPSAPSAEVTAARVFATSVVPSPTATPRTSTRKTKSRLPLRKPTPPPPAPPPEDRPPPPFVVSRTPSKLFPIYHLTKRGGNQKLTIIKKVDGDRTVFTHWLAHDLGLELDKITILTPSNNIGHRKGLIAEWLEKYGF